METPLRIQLVVKHPFATYNVGDHITDDALVAQLRHERKDYVIKKVNHEPAPAPAPATDAK